MDFCVVAPAVGLPNHNVDVEANQVDGAAKQLKEKAYDLEKKRPELAFEWQLENYKAIATAVSNLADSIKSQADVLGKAVPTNLGKAQP